jgi:hypothetical protein
VFDHKNDKLRRNNCLAQRASGANGAHDKRADIRAADAVDRVAAKKAARDFKERMDVSTPDGNGRVIGVNLVTGSIEVRVTGFPRPRAYPATSVTKL